MSFVLVQKNADAIRHPEEEKATAHVEMDVTVDSETLHFLSENIATQCDDADAVLSNEELLVSVMESQLTTIYSTCDLV